MKILLGLTGSVASSLAPKLARELRAAGHEIVTVITNRSKEFYNFGEVAAQSKHVYEDEDEWGSWGPGDPILHIELRNWADLFLIAPLSANTLAKMANGICDNLLTSIVRAWPIGKPLVYAPAMNTEMWRHPITRKQLEVLESFGYTKVAPIVKKLACGDVGIGAMAHIDDIMAGIKTATGWTFPLESWNFNGLPGDKHPGSFGFSRKHDVHTGVDLYTTTGAKVKAMEYGTVIKVIPFTGKNALDKEGQPMDWWLNTSAVLVRGASGVICYGEVEEIDGIQEGVIVKQGTHIANVVPVLRPEKLRKDIPGHSCSMLHVEWYSALYDDLSRGVWEGWELGKEKPAKLLDPSEKLSEAMWRSMPHHSEMYLRMKD